MGTSENSVSPHAFSSIGVSMLPLCGYYSASCEHIALTLFLRVPRKIMHHIGSTSNILGL